MNAKKINASDRNITPGIGVLQNTMVKAGDFNLLVDDVTAIETAMTTAKSVIHTDSMLENTTNHGIIIEGVTLKDSTTTSPSGFLTATGYFAGIIPFATQQAITASGVNTAVNLTTYYAAVTSTGTGNKISLAATGASVGQLKKIKYVAEGAGGDTVVLTPSVTTGFATCTFNAVGDYAVFMFNGTYWMCIENFGCTLA